MKHLYLLSILAIFFTTSKLGAQVTGFAINGLNLPTTLNPASCDSIVNIGFSAVNPNTSTASGYDLPYVITGNNFNGFQFQAVVNWGDGSTSNSGGGTSTSGTNISMNPPLAHTYNAPGTYLITTTVYNPANQTYAYDSINYTIGACNFLAYTYVGLDCDNNGTIEQALNNVPFVLVGAGMSYQGTPASNTMLQFNNVLMGTYTLQISPQWLLANGYQVQSSVPSTTINLPNSGVSTFAFTLICAQGVQSFCATGQVYCDANDNGFLDNGETPIANAPISVNGVTAYTNANGIYNLNYAGLLNTNFTLSMSSAWLSQHGYVILNNNGSNVTTITGTPCNSGAPITTVNFPLSCGGAVSPTQCYSGYVFCDANNNGIFDAGETPLVYAPVQLYAGTTTNSVVTVYTNGTGFFQYCGNFSNSANFVFANISSQWLVYNGYNSTTASTTVLGSINGQTNFASIAINCGGPTSTCADLWTSVTPWIGYYQNSVAYIKLNWGSYGPSAVGNYTLSMTFPTGVSPILASIQNPNYTITGNTITWNLSSSSTNFTNYDVIQFNVPGGLINGAQHYFTSSIAPTGSISDCGTYNNAGNLLQILGNSYDPNDKNACTDYQNDNFPLGYLDAFVDDALTYTIRFQNTGTAPAQNIYIIDTLDAALDWNSFTLIEASHNMQVVNLGNGIYRFEFPQIWLPDSTTNEAQSHGHLTYRITELPNNPINSTIENTAYIYFDWNSPIITNTTYNINMWIDGINELENQLVIYPNPATDEIRVSLEQPTSVRVSDINGKILLEQVLQPGEALKLGNLNAGIYMIDAGSKRTKLIKN